ncbi:MAG: ABC transporter permease [Gammaproteobacteria bacterium]
MRRADIIRYALRAIFANHLRTALVLAATAIGVAAVIVLAALGDGARRYVVGEFASLGTNLLIVLPGRVETTGGPPPLTGDTSRDLTLDDAMALKRDPRVGHVAPLIVGTVPANFAGLEREITVMGTTWEFEPIRHLSAAQGRFLPRLEPNRAAPVCVLGAKVARELFGNASALNQWLRLGDRRYRVIGVMPEVGTSIGADLDEVVIIPVAAAQALFNRESLFRILVESRTREDIAGTKAAIESIIQARHEGELDVTVITQDSVIATFDRILGALSVGVAGIAAISLVVAGILIMNIMLVTVAQRTTEIGLLKAIGAAPAVIRRVFLAEALLLSVLGAACGVALGVGIVLAVGWRYPSLPLAAPLWSIAAACAIAGIAGTGFGVLPAVRAARLDPVAALARR